MIPSIVGEWTKARTLASTGWILLFVVVSMAGLALAVTGTFRLDDCAAPCLPDTTKLSLSGVRLAQVGAVLIGVLVVTSDYASRTIVPTLMAVPRRSSVVLGKLSVVAVLTFAGGAVGVASAVCIAHFVLPSRGFGSANAYVAHSLLHDLTQRAAVGTVAYLVLVAVLSSGVALLVRDTAGAVTATLGVLFLTAFLGLFVSDPVWQDRIQRYSPMDAGLAIQWTRDLGALHIGQWAGLGLLTGYAVVAVAAGGLSFARRDA